MKSCTAVVEGDRIQLIIRKGEDGYAAFADVLNAIEKQGCMSWYGDVADAAGKEQSGLVITTPPESKATETNSERTNNEATTEIEEPEQ